MINIKKTLKKVKSGTDADATELANALYYILQDYRGSNTTIQAAKNADSVESMLTELKELDGAGKTAMESFIREYYNTLTDEDLIEYTSTELNDAYDSLKESWGDVLQSQLMVSDDFLSQSENV
jgi:5'-deoxynucleotidase YfbR-like HD superfamily hydrolase